MVTLYLHLHVDSQGELLHLSQNRLIPSSFGMTSLTSAVVAKVRHILVLRTWNLLLLLFDIHC